ncbi:hypothetical protein Fcan01_28007 [Folsomia candida]|uniref:Uncharacterized protein n=1 Tax=Folsomia candida TaxID=158441 RepID=A0A226CWA8_FOLCA|nr:hypothetical protein Fcan01_28007 [Folsomia candida]
MLAIKNVPKFLLVSIALSQLHPVSGALVAKLYNATVPVVTLFAGVSYDGDDSIYHFGGWNIFPTETDPQPMMDAIWRYSISADAFELVARLPFGMVLTSIVNSVEGTYYIFGGLLDETNWQQYSVFKLSVESGTVTEVAQLPNIGHYYGAFKRDEETVFLIRNSPSAVAENQTVLRYDAIREEGTLINFGEKNFTGYATSPTDSLRRYGYAMGSYNSVSSLLDSTFGRKTLSTFRLKFPLREFPRMGWDGQSSSPS